MSKWHLRNENCRAACGRRNADLVVGEDDFHAALNSDRCKACEQHVEQRNAYTAGFYAGQNGKKAADNPHPKGTKHEYRMKMQWHMGWFDGTHTEYEQE